MKEFIPTVTLSLEEYNYLARIREYDSKYYELILIAQVRGLRTEIDFRYFKNPNDKLHSGLAIIYIYPEESTRESGFKTQQLLNPGNSCPTLVSPLAILIEKGLNYINNLKTS